MWGSIRAGILPLFFVLFTAVGGQSQELSLDTSAIKEVLRKWNFAHNGRSLATFRELYAPTVTYYTERLSREKCIASKRKFFVDNPDAAQRIVGEPRITPYTSGVIACEFTKEVFLNSKWRAFPSYLLIDYNDHSYLINGESDEITDRRLRFKLNLGDPIRFNSTVHAELEAPTDTVSPSQQNRGATLPAILDRFPLGASIVKEITSEEEVIVPKKYVYYLVGFLLVMLALNLFVRRPAGTAALTKSRATRSERGMIRTDKAFEAFVVSLFDPLYFTLIGPNSTAERRGFTPDLEFYFQNKNASARFGVQCFYLQQRAGNSLINFTDDLLDAFDEYETRTGSALYIVVGVGGEAAFPNETYYMRASDINAGELTYSQLQRYRKSGMFFYNTIADRLQ